MIPVETLIGFDDNGQFWVKMINMEDHTQTLDGPFDSREDAEQWVTDYMEKLGGIDMGPIDGTRH
jgi:hypothetical protein